MATSSHAQTLGVITFDTNYFLEILNIDLGDTGKCDDIDVTNTDDVLWALATRSNPEQDIEIIRRSWSGALDPIIPKGQKGHSSRGIIDACCPYEWLSDFPPVAESSEAVRKAAEAKWGKILAE